MKLLPLKLAVLARDCYTEITRYNELESVDKNNPYRSDRYKEIHNLVANTQSRSVADLFERSTTAAVIYNLVKTHTQFFCGDTDEEMFKEILLLHFQTAPCNFHEISELSSTKEGYFETQEIGAGAFAFLSLFNHCCNPNVVRHCHGNVVVLRAIRSIAKGEQCYDNYG
uniref:SET and MYND domain-containing protein 4-like n=1 Tax=Diabrotica virgifera virgifera TaxID=50390 RepID=A0A6P7G1M4_DIAVI